MDRCIAHFQSVTIELSGDKTIPDEKVIRTDHQRIGEVELYGTTYECVKYFGSWYLTGNVLV